MSTHSARRRAASAAVALTALAALAALAPAARAQSGSPPDPAPPNGAPAPAPAAPPAPQRGGFLARLARGLDQVNAVATTVRLQKAVRIDLESRGLQPVTYNGATLGVSAMDVRDRAGVRLHLYLHNTGDQALAVPAPSAGLFALIDERGRSSAVIGQLAAEAGGGHATPAVANGSLAIPALERVEFTLLFAAPPADATALMLRITGAGVIRGLPAHADGAASQAVSTAQSAAPATAPAGPSAQPASTAGSGSPP